MLRALLTKEWIKIRWVLLVCVAVSAVTLLNLFLSVRKDFTLGDANAIWNAVVHRKAVFYEGIQWNALGTGILLALAQFVPEVRRRRLRLLFHLPVHQDVSLGVMLGAGAAATLVVALLNLLGLVLITARYFPGDVVTSAVLTGLPWLLAGVAAYGGGALVVLEPSWWRRPIFGAMAWALVSLCFLARTYEAYAPSIPWIALLATAIPITAFLPAYRFRRGR